MQELLFGTSQSSQQSASAYSLQKPKPVRPSATSAFSIYSPGTGSFCSSMCHAVHPRVILFIQVSLSSSRCHSVSPRVILFIHALFCLSMCHSIHPRIILFIHMSFCSSTCHSVHPRVILFIHVSICSSTCHSVHPRVIMFIHCHSVHLHVILFIHVSLFSSTCHSVHPCVILFIHASFCCRQAGPHQPQQGLPRVQSWPPQAVPRLLRHHPQQALGQRLHEQEQPGPGLPGQQSRQAKSSQRLSEAVWPLSHDL